MSRYAFKDDKNKEPFHLIPEQCVREILAQDSKYKWAGIYNDICRANSTWDSFIRVKDVLKYGAIKYKEDSWKYIEDAQDRYCGAFLRHINKWGIDEESGLEHISHALCNAMFLLWFEMGEDK